MAKKKTTLTGGKYIAIVGLKNSKSGKEWQPGDEVTDGDFAPQIIENWLQIGAIKKAGD